MKKKIAVIGGGISGLAAAYLLNKKYEISLFEKNDRLGGNAYTYQTSTGETIDIGVGDVVTPHSRNFIKICDELNVELVRQPASSFISFHNLETNNGLYVTPLSLKGLLAQKFSLYFSLMPLAKATGILGKAEKLMDEGKLKGLSFEEALKLLPELSGIGHFFIMGTFFLFTGMSYEDMLNVPVEFFIDAYKAHARFNPLEMTTYFSKYHTKSYVEALSSSYRDRVYLNSNIQTILRDNGCVKIRLQNGEEQIFDKVVFACNADQALALLESPTKNEKKLLGPWKHNEIPMIVHRDHSSLPKRELCQPWTIIQAEKNGKPDYSISLCSWMHPAVSNNGDYLATSLPNFPIQKDLIELKTSFRMPHHSFESYATIEELPSLNGTLNAYYCGAYFGYGLHGDAVNSAITVAKELGID